MEFGLNSVFETPSHERWLAGYRWSDLSGDSRLVSQSRSYLKECLGFAVEPAVEIMSSGVFEKLGEAALQRSQAAAMFCRDVYRKRDPVIFRRYPALKNILETNPYFVSSVVGHPTAVRREWDFAMAMDWAFEGSDNIARVRLVESDTGGIGGMLRIAMTYEAFRSLLTASGMSTHVRDSSEYLTEFLERFRSLCGTDPKVLIFSEDDLKDQILDRWGRSGTTFHPSGGRSYLASILRNKRIETLGSWNRNRIDVKSRRDAYLFDGSPLDGIIVRYWPSAIDPTGDWFDAISEAFIGDVYDRHFVPGFWGPWLSGASCRVFNPLGCELFADKATSSFIEDLIKFYLEESPKINDQSYVTFMGDHSSKLIDRVFGQKDAWVVKRRVTPGSAHGVEIGAKVTSARWEALKLEVARSPEKFVAQRLIQSASFASLGGSCTLYPELRIVSYTMDGEAFLIPGVLARCSPSQVALRTLRDEDNSIIPVFLGRESAASRP
jgi:uncharacterized circularly permuted ATP-grasp superfamily protein